MQIHFQIPAYKQAPFLRLVLALVPGILLQWYVGFSIGVLLSCVGVIAFLFLLFSFLFHKKIIGQAIVKSIFLQSSFIIMGALLVYVHLIIHHRSYFEHKSNSSQYATVLVLQEPLVEKTKTYKADASIVELIENDTAKKCIGNIILYFKKDSTKPALDYGSTILINKPLQPIKNNGNPGAFDYAQFTLMKGFTHQLFLNSDEYKVLPRRSGNQFKKFLFSVREKVLAIIQKNITPIKERGLAEALLIGYRDDLDKDLSQAYSNTGTVHVIAISGLHLGFIYLLLLSFFNYLEKIFTSARIGHLLSWVKPISIILVLWIFSLVAGGAPSILRSAIMFTCIVIGDRFGKNNSILNTLAISAFIILCLNPFALWDVGFQLSYAAVVSIVLFMKPIYNWFYFKNKALNWFWKLNAITLSAQILTLPVTMFHFHQFPNLFLITNIVAVPLSTIILGGELLLVILSWWKPVASFLGDMITKLITAMNNYIEWCSSFRFALTDYINISLGQTFLLYGILFSFCYWLLSKKKHLLFVAMGFTCLFLVVNIVKHKYTHEQAKIVVYNIPKFSGIDFIKSNQFEFVGDSSLEQEGFNKNFHIKPSRIFYNTHTHQQKLTYQNKALHSFANKNFLLINDNYLFDNKHGQTISIEALVISKNPRLYIDSLIGSFAIKNVVADATNPMWKIRLWAEDCKRLGIPFHYTGEKGAFVRDL